MPLVDLSSHFLDGMSCGPESFADSLKMCRSAAAEGVQTVVATPRWAAGSTEPPLPLTECRRKIERLQAELGSTLSLKLGFTLQFSPQLPSLVDRYGATLALGGKRHLLVSLPALNIPAEAEQVWRALADRGLSTIIAQPECSPVLRKHPTLLAHWIAEGLKLQINAASVAGAYGREIRRYAINLLRTHETGCFVASNACGNGAALPSLKRAQQELRSELGDRRASRFVRDLPAAIIEDEPGADKSSKKPARWSSLLRAFRPAKAFDNP
jgi:protein-tyrosine phosphatase